MRVNKRISLSLSSDVPQTLERHSRAKLQRNHYFNDEVEITMLTRSQLTQEEGGLPMAFSRNGHFAAGAGETAAAFDSWRNLYVNQTVNEGSSPAESQTTTASEVDG